MNPIIKSAKNQINADNTVSNLNDMLFQQLDEIVKLDVNDENFNRKKDKVLVFAEVADRIIKNNQFALNCKVWNANQKYRMSERLSTDSYEH